jgi:hypothetical protein
MERFPISPKRRRRYERAIRILDLIVYFVVTIGGLAAVFATPTSATDALIQQPLLIAVWAVLLLGGGSIGFLGRLTRYWLIEGPAAIAAFSGAAIYLALLFNAALASATTTLAAALVAVAMLALGRRVLELQIFGTEPNAPWKQRIRNAITRRTTDVVPRDI